MWRISRRIPYYCRNGENVIQQTSVQPKYCQRCQERFNATKQNPTASSSSSSSGGGSGSRIILGVIGISAVVGGGTLIYAKYDPKFRSTLENSVPYSEVALNYIIGEKDDAEVQKKVDVIGSKPPTADKSVPAGLLQKKLERDAAKRQVTTEPVSQPALPKNEMKVMPSSHEIPEVKESKVSNPTTDKDLQRPKSAEVAVTDKILQQRIIGQDAVSAAENSAIETLAKEAIQEVKQSISAALGSYEKAVQAIEEHKESLQRALDAPQDQSQTIAWNDVKSASQKKNSAVSAAENSGLNVRKSFEKLKNIIQDGQKSKVTAKNPTLLNAEEVLSKAVYELQKAESTVTLALAETNILAEYQKLVEQGKEQFRKELQSLVPDVKVSEKGKKLSEDELNYLIAHAHRKVDQLQKQLAAQQAGEKTRVEQLLNAQHKEYEKLVSHNVSLELERQQRELQIAYQKKLNDSNEEFEQELLQQLRRQAAAHSEHIRDVLQAQRKNLEIEFEDLVDDKVREARYEFQQELAGSLGRLQGIESGLKSRAELDCSLRRAQHLRQACQALDHSIRLGNANAKNWEEQLKPLASEVTAISRTGEIEGKFVQAVLGAIPEEAIHRGVFTEDALKDRFFKVDRVCRQVAMIDERGGNLLKFALSYLQSLFVFPNTNLPAVELSDEPFDVSKLNTFDILDRAKWYIDRNNFEQALRYMNLLSGAPRNVAGDWLKETRMLLEVQQVTRVLLARAGATETQASIA